jgi:hypothetical protein
MRTRAEQTNIHALSPELQHDDCLFQLACAPCNIPELVGTRLTACVWAVARKHQITANKQLQQPSH